MPRRKEVPYAPIPTEYETDDGPQIKRVIELYGTPMLVSARQNPIAALMECAPHSNPEWSIEELLPLREVIEDAIDTLTPRERWVFNSFVVERQSLRSLGRQLALSKSQVFRIKEQAVARLQAALEDHPLVKEYLTR